MRNEDLKQKRKDDKRSEHWWEEPIEGFNLRQLIEFKCGLENFKKTMTAEAFKYFQATGHNFYFGSSSNAALGIFDYDGNTSSDLDLFNHRRMVGLNTFSCNHQNMVIPHPSTIPSGNNVIERFAPENNESHNQYRLKQEPSSECDHQPDHPPQF
ncbi:unnamed protein product [Eruca vesicaria subsp. sativa]|uniref:Uncharacterized protein n=1 Tax=Eruca vesicaria subsp. sativa TaxID=29727 RepID=A0ABC8LN80_ERUVS|nr:unnamed protein product [Eruca vesicaria subsp. sativa]